MSVIPVAPLIAINVNSSTIICSQPKRNRIMFRDSNKPCHVDHKQINGAVFKRFTVVGTVDVVFCLCTADRVFGGGSGWRYFVDCVVGGC